MGKLMVQAVAELQPRPDDVEPSQEELERLSLVESLKKKPDIRKYPKSMLLRHYRKGEVVCRQGEAGSSAYYILTAEDEVKLRRHQLKEAEDLLASFSQSGATSEDVEDVNKEIQSLTLELQGCEARQNEVDGLPANDPSRQMATAHVFAGAGKLAARRSRNPLKRLGQRLFGDVISSAPEDPQFIPIDGPADVDYATRRAPMYDGDVFGEMSCLTFAPRSATVVATRDCYLLEFLRNIFDQIQRDASYKKRTEKLYRERVLSSHLSRSKVFQGIESEDLDILRSSAQLSVVDPGTVIFEEGELSDAVYIVRSGMVRVVQDYPLGLRQDDISDWQGVCKTLVAAADKAIEAKAKDSDASADKAPKKKASGALEALKAKLAAKADPNAPAATQQAKNDQDATVDAGPKSKVEQLKARLAQKATALKKEPAEGKEKHKESATVSVPKSSPAGVTPVDEQIEPGSQVVVPSVVGDDAVSADRIDQLITQIQQKASAKRERVGGDRLVVLPTDTKPEKTDAAKPTGEATAKAAKPKKPASSASPTGASSALAALKAGKKASPSVPPALKLWQALSPSVQEIVRKYVEQPTDDDHAVNTMLEAINLAARDPKFVTSKDVESLIQNHELLAPARAFDKKVKNWTDLEVRTAGYLLIRAILPKGIESVGTGRRVPRTLAYLSRGDMFGEMGVLDSKSPERTATTIAFDHPQDGKRAASRLELIRIHSDTFRKLLASSSAFKEKVGHLIDERRKETQQIQKAPPWRQGVLEASTEYRELNLSQGQRLLLVDLNRCTRCGDCVQACVDTHDDGYSRLFLDGPRFGQFLVPSACRNCRDPACMIGCPVGSIQRGEHGEILIRDWCIGCGLCANQCPYDSIQMHDSGVVPAFSSDWWIAPIGTLHDDSWISKKFRTKGWRPVITPIYGDPNFASHFDDPAHQKDSESTGSALRFSFDSPRREVRDDSTLRLLVESKAAQIEVWINATSIELHQDAKQKRRGEYSANVSADLLHSVGNVVAVRITGPFPDGEIAMSLRLDTVTALDSLPEGVEDAELKMVTERAVVCDLCGTPAGTEPACVSSCPHDAAFRVDGLVDLQSDDVLARR